jgi:surface-anchored protein
MLKITSRLLGAAAVVTAAVVGITASPAVAATIDTGHVDVLDVDYSGGTVTLDIRTYSPANDDVSPAGNTIRLHPLANYDLVVPASPSSWGCVGAANSTVYVAPSSVPTGDTRVWPGWNTEDVPTANRPVTIQLVSVSGPGHVTLYNMTGLPAAPSVVLSNSSTSGCAKSTFSIGGTPHGHANWAFSAPGDYQLTLKATVTGGATSGNVVYNFTIG